MGLAIYRESAMHALDRPRSLPQPDQVSRLSLPREIRTLEGGPQRDFCRLFVALFGLGLYVGVPLVALFFIARELGARMAGA